MSLPLASGEGRDRGACAASAARRNGQVNDEGGRAYLARLEVAALLGDLPVTPGCLVGVCNLLDCFPTEDVCGTISDMERLVGDFGDGRYAWQLSDVREFREPIPCGEAQGVWNAPPFGVLACAETYVEHV